MNYRWTLKILMLQVVKIIIKLSKTKSVNHKVQIIDHKTENRYLVEQSSWYNKNDEYKFRYNGCSISKQILDKVVAKKDKTILQLYPNKNLRTCVMLLDMEDKFTFIDKRNKREENLLYPYYQGSKKHSRKSMANSISRNIFIMTNPYKIQLMMN